MRYEGTVMDTRKGHLGSITKYALGMSKEAHGMVVWWRHIQNKAIRKAPSAIITNYKERFGSRIQGVIHWYTLTFVPWIKKRSNTDDILWQTWMGMQKMKYMGYIHIDKGNMQQRIITSSVVKKQIGIHNTARIQ